MSWKRLALLALVPLASCQTDTANIPLTFGGVVSTWSAACAKAMNVSIPSCPRFLLGSSLISYRFNTEDLNALCTTGCKSALSTARQNIVKACTSANDTVQLEGSLFPASIIVDKCIYAYNVGCRKDASSGRYCDQIFYSWLNQSTLTSAQNCSDCNLGVAQLQLNSPFGYDDQYAADFSALTSSCKAKSYSFTSQTPYTTIGAATSTSTAVNATVTSCASTYAVKSGDTCNSIASAKNVSTYGIINAGHLDAGCTTLQAGASLCLPGPCKLYQVQNFDTCTSIISKVASGVTAAQFLGWNANINSLCGNIGDLVGTYICVSPPGGVISVPSITSPLATSTATTPVPKPTNAPAESNSRCGYWYTVQEGDTCNSVAQNRGILLKDFYFLNPEINSGCTNLLLGLAYCVRAVGNIQTYSGYPTTSQFFSLTSKAYNTTTSSLSATQTAALTPISYLPTASGTKPKCSAYVNYTYIPAIVDQSQASNLQYVPASSNNCDYLAGEWNVNADFLLQWNPSLKGVKPCALQPGFSYCVLLNSSAQTPISPPGQPCVEVNRTAIKTGTISSCNCFTEIDGFDNSTYLCNNIATDANITVANLQQWNSWIGSNCDSGLYAGMSGSDTRPVCIGVNGTGQSTTTTKTTATGTATTSSMGPTLSGTVSNCRKYYTTQDGDGCESVESRFGITFAQFYSWNTEIGNNCQSLWIGYAYCVSGPSSTSTRSATTTSAAPAPTRSGTAAGCSTYYTVKSGDGCQSIETAFHITFQQLYKWNTNIGNDCQSLWPDYSVCVAGGPP